jgi:hypothetical protein
LLYKNFPADWVYYDIQQIISHPITMGLQRFVDLMNKSTKRLYSRRAIHNRVINTGINTKQFITVVWAYITDLDYRNLYFRSSFKTDFVNKLFVRTLKAIGRFYDFLYFIKRSLKSSNTK